MRQLLQIYLLCILSPFLISFQLPIRLRGLRNSNHGGKTSLRMEIFEGNPIGRKIWDNVWKLPIMQRGEQGVSPTTFGDAANVLRNNILQIYGNETSYDGAPVAVGQVDGLLEGSMFLGLKSYYDKYGSVYKLLFGPKSFIVVSDPTIAKFILRENPQYYDKGVLAEILEPIMGKGLIPADPDTWKVRRKALVPGFHRAWYNRMIKTFVQCNSPLMTKLEQASLSNEVLDMETEFCSVALDIIGKAVFNYDFGSVTKESPIVKAVYRCLQEAEHRSMTPLPYWDLPLANQLVPRLVKFNKDLQLLNTVLDELIVEALSTKNQADVEELENRDYDTMENPSLLRFLVDMRGEDTTSRQLRDDLMTMLVAGHETTAAVLTWSLFELSQKPHIVEKAREELFAVLGDRDPTFDDIPNLPYLRLILTESLRMYPEPPLLIRRALVDHTLPKGSAGFETKVMRGADIFLSTYNLHRSAEYWEDPDDFNPERYLKPYSNPNHPNWAGYKPNNGTLYPNEIHSDFAFLPFGGGPRKCIGDQFALFESAVTLAMVLRKYDFSLAIHPSEVGVATGATIHTRNGLMMRVRKYEAKRS